MSAHRPPWCLRTRSSEARCEPASKFRGTRPLPAAAPKPQRSTDSMRSEGRFPRHKRSARRRQHGVRQPHFWKQPRSHRNPLAKLTQPGQAPTRADGLPHSTESLGEAASRDGSGDVISDLRVMMREPGVEGLGASVGCTDVRDHHMVMQWRLKGCRSSNAAFRRRRELAIGDWRMASRRYEWSRWSRVGRPATTCTVDRLGPRPAA